MPDTRPPAAARRVLVTHGEPAAAEALAARLRETPDWTAQVPAMGESVTLG